VVRYQILTAMARKRCDLTATEAIQEPILHRRATNPMRHTTTTPRLRTLVGSRLRGLVHRELGEGMTKEEFAFALEVEIHDEHWILLPIEARIKS
jgi:hypothetical protein